jgi:Flp pilus assembly protein TadG
MKRIRRVSTQGARRHAQPKRKGQALVELALMGTLLAMLLAGAVDLGRAYYTAVVVTNMAGEGAAYAAIYPDRDENLPSCAQLTTDPKDYIQNRIKRVAIERGLVISPQRVTDITVRVNGSGNCTVRCANNTINVKVTYVINDLFLPGLLGMNSITISRSASQRIATNAYNASCSIN